jgi:Zn finger protein HypA/HybF involved in hydrogenase expression
MIDARFFVALLGSSSYDVKVVDVSLFKMIDEEACTGLLIVEKAKRGIKIKIYCECCRKYRTFYFFLGSLNKRGGHFIYCPECNLELAYLGTEDEVNRVVGRHQQEVETLIKEMGLEDFFKNPFVIYDLINYIHDLAEKRKIFCQCGSHDISAGFNFDKIELICKKCGNINHINAGNYEDLERIKKMDSIVINTSHGRNKVIKY